MSSQPRMACVVATVGRPVHLDTLLRSLADQTLPPSHVIVVDQSTNTKTADVIDTWRDRLPLRRLTSARGASLGRNTGLAALGDDYDIVTFPDDDVRLAPDALANAAAAFATGHHIGVVSGAVNFPGGHRSHRICGGRRTVLTKATVRTNTIEAGCFFRAAFLRGVGGFDETLGVGNPTPWQSTAGLDLLLRGLRAGWTILFDPAIAVYETGYNGTPEDLLYRVKCRHYARGAGRVYRRHYGPRLIAPILVREMGGVVFFLATGRRRRAAWCLQQIIGILEGLTGRVFSQVRAPEPLEARRFYDTSACSATGTGEPGE
ncbi:glycosyltransferase family A protein [Actinoallomurus sp. NPDC052308]|uniref:glycosyltransferase family 2 protein n=1 Tax=Actinoallomurus sp. NPDC052308 TaxID=3155530 RepID=UPI00342D53A6